MCHGRLSYISSFAAGGHDAHNLGVRVFFSVFSRCGNVSQCAPGWEACWVESSLVTVPCGHHLSSSGPQPTVPAFRSSLPTGILCPCHAPFLLAPHPFRPLHLLLGLHTPHACLAHSRSSFEAPGDAASSRKPLPVYEDGSSACIGHCYCLT